MVGGMASAMPPSGTADAIDCAWSGGHFGVPCDSSGAWAEEPWLSCFGRVVISLDGLCVSDRLEDSLVLDVVVCSIHVDGASVGCFVAICW